MRDQIPANPALEKANSIIRTRLAYENPSHLLLVTCGPCGRSFYFDALKSPPEIDEGIISDAHGVVRGFQFRFPCPRCDAPLRFDEDEIITSAEAKHVDRHS